MPSLADIRARISAAENKQQNNEARTPADNVLYAHWNMSEGATATVRFLPDGDNKNTFFWVERQQIKLPFNGIKGEMNKKMVVVTVPCVEMWGDSCPILAEVRPWYKDETLKEMANKYWKKRSYLFQGFVRQNPIGDDKTPANPIRKLIISPQIFTIIKSSLMDPEMEELPTDYVNGLDFNIKKTAKGKYSDYSTSNWSRKVTPLTEMEQAAIEAHGLFNISDWLPKRPSEAELNIMKEMFEASVDGQAYDADRWGNYFKPYGLDVPEGAEPNDSRQSQPKAQPKPQAQPVQVHNDEPEEIEAPVAAAQPVKVPAASGSTNAADILAMIRSRQNKG
jgi:hypothetical protein